jgi:hypothetical protein
VYSGFGVPATFEKRSTKGTKKNEVYGDDRGRDETSVPSVSSVFSVLMLLRGLSRGTAPGIRPDRRGSPCETAPAPSSCSDNHY